MDKIANIFKEQIMYKKLAVMAASALIATSVFAADTHNLADTIVLKDGSTLYIYKDGKMTMEDKVGRPTTMMEGHAMETKDGQKIMMKGNEIWRLHRVTP